MFPLIFIYLNSVYWTSFVQRERYKTQGYPDPPHPKIVHWHFVMWRDAIRLVNSKMAPTPGEEGASKEHAAAITRDYISQPRLSQLLYILLMHLFVSFDFWSSWFLFLNRLSFHVRPELFLCWSHVYRLFWCFYFQHIEQFLV